MSKGEKKEYNVTVLSQREVSVFPEVGREVKQVQVTYVAAGLPPATVTIPKEKFNEALLKQTIRKHIEQRLKEKPVSFTV